MYSPFVRGRFFLTPFVVETILVFGLVYALGQATMLAAPAAFANNPLDMLQILVGALPLAASISWARHTRRRVCGSIEQELTLAALLTFVLASGAALLFYLLQNSSKGQLAALTMLQAAIAVPTTTIAWRYTVTRLRVPGFCMERVIILGTGRLAEQVVDYIEENKSDDYEVVGFAFRSDKPPQAPREMAPLYAYEALRKLTPRDADRIVVALEEKRGNLPVRELVELRLRGVPVEEATSFVERSSGKINVESLLPSWIIFADGFRVSPVRRIAKRIIDFFLAAILLVVSAPFMVLTALAIRLEGPGPLLYGQQRVGRDGRVFTVYKFRSMIPDAEKHSGPKWADEDDPRVTKVGRVIRKLRLDELPQAWNVFRGDMSFVGPRPERPHFVKQLEEAIPFYKLRESMRPGLTGWAQVQYGYGASVDDSREKLKFDLFYIKNANLLLDLWIVIKTIKVVIVPTGR